MQDSWLYTVEKILVEHPLHDYAETISLVSYIKISLERAKHIPMWATAFAEYDATVSVKDIMTCFSFTIFARQGHLFTSPSANGQSSQLSREQYLEINVRNFCATEINLMASFDRISPQSFCFFFAEVAKTSSKIFRRPFFQHADPCFSGVASWFALLSRSSQFWRS